MVCRQILNYCCFMSCVFTLRGPVTLWRQCAVRRHHHFAKRWTLHASYGVTLWPKWHVWAPNEIKCSLRACKILSCVKFWSPQNENSRPEDNLWRWILKMHTLEKVFLEYAWILICPPAFSRLISLRISLKWLCSSLLMTARVQRKLVMAQSLSLCTRRSLAYGTVSFLFIQVTPSIIYDWIPLDIFLVFFFISCNAIGVLNRKVWYGLLQCFVSLLIFSKVSYYGGL